MARIRIFRGPAALLTACGVLLAAGCGPADAVLDVVEPDIPEHGDGMGVSEDELSRQQLAGASMASKMLSLTYDDGPGPRTVELAEYLNAQGIRATFFMNGRNILKFPDVPQRLVALGHLVANHTQTHAQLTRSGVDAYAELAQTDSLIDDWVPPSTFAFRAPYGAWSSALADSLNETDMKKYVGSIFWNIGGTLTATYAADWNCWSAGLSVSTCTQRYLNEVEDRKKGVVLMHDVHSKTVDMTKSLVPELKRRGYRFQRVDAVPSIYDSLASTSNQPVVSIAKRVGFNGFWVAWADGRVMGFGEAVGLGPSKAFTPVGRVVALAGSSTSTAGYWLLTENGGIYPYGDVEYFSSPRRQGVTDKTVAMVSTPSNKGYWVATANGGVYAFGDAAALGSLTSAPPAPIVAMTRTTTGKGLWLTTSSGHVYGFGDAQVRGGLSGSNASPIVGMVRTTSNNGYWLLAKNGTVFAFGDAAPYGSVTNASGPLVGMAPSGYTRGYWVASQRGVVYAFGSAESLPAQ